MIVLDDISVRVAGRLLVEHASVAIPDRARVGLVGRNGAGKTTLFRAIAGELEPETGIIRVPNGTRIGTVAQEAPSGDERLIDLVLAADTERARLLAERETASDPHRISEIESRLIEVDAHSARARAARILAGLGFDEAAQQRPCSEFSGGWRMRVALAALLFAEPDLLLLDEPTNYLDLEGTLWLQEFLARYRRTMILVSHDRDLLESSVGFILHLERGKLTLYRGPFSQFERQRRERLAHDDKQRAKQEALRARYVAFVERFRAKATKARQAQSRLKALARMEPLAPPVEEAPARISIRSPERTLAPPIVAMEGVAVGYAPARPVLKRLSLRIDDDDRIALLGQNGNGKSTFARLLAGRLKPQAGSLIRADKLRVAYFAQHQLDELDAGESPYQHVRRLMPDAPEAQVRGRAAETGFSGEAADTPVGALSGGEKARLLIGLASLAGPHLLILDEPTNHLDIETRAALIEAINEYRGAVVMVSHDRALLDACAERLWLVAAGTVKPFAGDLEDYRRLVLSRAGGEPRAPAATRENDRGALRRAAAERRNELAPLRRQIKSLEADVERLEAEISEIDRVLAGPELYAGNAADAAALAKRRAEASRRLAEVEERWLSLSAEYERAQGAV